MAEDRHRSRFLEWRRVNAIVQFLGMARFIAIVLPIQV
jgi:hypothetical protein